MQRTKKIHYWDLIRELAITDFKLKYQGSIVGYLWSLVKPMALFGVLFVVFTLFVKLGANEPHYPIYLLIGIVLWSYFAESTINGMRAIVDKGDLIRKIYFPRSVLVLSSSISSLITLVLNLLIIALFLLLSGLPITFSATVFVIILIELFILSLGASYLLAALYVKFRDFSHIWELILQLLFYASAIIFPLSIIPEKYVGLLLLNPITQIMQDSRKILIDSSIVSSADKLDAPLLLLPYLFPLVLFAIGYLFFIKSAARFAEEV